jgi:hypothetical protein
MKQPPAIEAPTPVVSPESVFIPSKVARIAQLPAMYGDAFTERLLRDWIWNSEWCERVPWPELRECVIRIGRVVFIDVRKFDAWLLKHAGCFDKSVKASRPAKGRA